MKRHAQPTTPAPKLRWTPTRPGSVPIVDLDDTDLDQPFAEGARDALDADLRHRIVSEAAFHRLAERGYDESGGIEDWLEAEADFDHMLVSRGPRGSDASER